MLCINNNNNNNTINSQQAKQQMLISNNSINISSSRNLHLFSHSTKMLIENQSND